MTATEFQDHIIRLLANNGYCRYWLDWRLLGRDVRTMVVAIVDLDHTKRATYHECPDLEARGFKKVIYDGGIYYAIERTDPDLKTPSDERSKR